MKNSLISPVLGCIAILFTHTSCNQAVDEQSLIKTLNETAALSNRSDCDLCPEDEECCCGAWLQPGSSGAFLQICGTTNGMSACMGAATGNCPSFSGGGLIIELTLTEPRQPFCVGENSPFYIRNLSGTSTALIIITCQADLISSDTMWLQIPPNEFRYIGTNNACAMGPCE